MLLTKEQFENGYPYEAVRFLDTFASFLSKEKDSYGLPLLDKNAFLEFDKYEKGKAEKLELQYHESIEEIHNYIDAGYSI